jgi:uncharacterized cupredoxin-like copper-binding protein
MRRIVMVVALLAFLVAGCGDDGGSGDDVGADGTATTAPPVTDASGDAAEPFEFDVTSVDFGYELATDEVPAGPVDVVQTNEGDYEHQVTLIRLDDGQTPDQLLDTITNDGDDALDPSVFAGGPNGIPAGETNAAQVNLTPGEYVAYCFIPQHAQQGMVEPFTVTGEAAEPAPVQADATVSLSDFQFDVPQDFTGQGTVAVTNQGDQPHEWTIVGGTPDAQVGAGGLTTIAPGETGYVDLDLAPGDYQFVCFVTDPESGQIHLQLGMQAEVTVS